MNASFIVAGAGIGGLAAALGLARAGVQVRVLERNTELAEYGAGIQLGPNVTRRLAAWDLTPALDAVVSYPEGLSVRDARTRRELAYMALGASLRQRYGAPYVTIHRADLQQLLYQAATHSAGVAVEFGTFVTDLETDRQGVTAHLSQGPDLRADALVGADGLWSRVRQFLLADGEPRIAGHLAYRAVVRQSELPQALRSQRVTVWLGPRLHLVQYPVRGGEWLNVVAVVEGSGVAHGVRRWDHPGVAADLLISLRGAQAHTELIDLVNAIGHWGLWALCDRPPMSSATQQAQGRIALLGDAAHPMRPYMAQGAGMAIEDAAELQHQVQALGHDLTAALHAYAQARWQRNARVQQRAIRNGEIYHATGPMQWGRDWALQLLGQRIMDVPWLYGY